MRTRTHNEKGTFVKSLPIDLIIERIIELKEKRILFTDLIIELQSKMSLVHHKDDISILTFRIEKLEWRRGMLDDNLLLNERIKRNLQGEKL